MRSSSSTAAGFLPFQSTRLDGGHRLPPLSRHKLARERPSDYLGDFYYDTVAMSKESIHFLTHTVGSSRLLLGSDYPFPLGGPRPVDTVRDAGMSAHDSCAVLGENAATLFPRSTDA